MIALLAQGALAGPVRVSTIEVLATPATLHTASVSAADEVRDVNGQPQVTRLTPDRVGLEDRGLVVEIATPAGGMAPHEYLVMFGARIANPRFERTAFTFAPTAAEFTVDTALRGWFSPDREPLLDGYALAFTGVQLGFVAAAPFTRPTVAPALRTGGGIGVEGRRGTVRPRLEARVDIAARWDSLDGRVEEPTSAFTWRWFPGSAAASLFVGCGFAPRHESASTSER